MHGACMGRFRPRIALSAATGRAVLFGWLSLGLLLAAAVAGCGGHPQPAPMPPTQEEAPPPETEYLLRVGDELNLMVVGQGDFSGILKVRPDGKLTAPGVGELTAAGRSVAEVTEGVRSGLRRLIRHPEVSLMLTSYAQQLVYVFGEVRTPGAHPYLPNMTALHAIGAAGGPQNTGKMSRVLVLRRTGPNALDVYPLDLEQTVDAVPGARDVYLRPYDVVFVPRTFIAEVNLFVDKFIRQNIAPFTAYIEGWRTFHTSRISVRTVE